MSAVTPNDRLPVLLLLLLPVLFFADVLLGLANFCMRDLTRYYYPTKQIFRAIVHAGEFPFWNPFFHGGQPLAANPEHEVFYPITWLTLLPSYDLGYRLHILVHIAIALVGMYALLRSMRTGPVAAWFGAVSWGMGGLFLSYINLLPILFCAAWLPLTCLFVRRFLHRPGVRDFALASLVLGVQFLIAEPTTIMQTGVIIGMYGLYRGWPAPLRMAANTGWIALISAAAFAVGAVQMLPAIDHVGDSARSRPFPFDLVSAWSMPWPKLGEFIYPNLLGHVQLEGQIQYWGASLYGSMNAPFLFSIYPGLAATALVAAGIVCRVKGAALLIPLSAVSMAVALGDHTPLLRGLYDAGIAVSVRYPEKFILMAVFAATLYSARVLEKLLSGDARLRRVAAGFALATAIIAGAVSLSRVTPAGFEIWAALFGQERSPEAVSMATIAWGDWTVAVGRGLLLFFIMLAASAVRKRMWTAGAALFLLADLGPVVHELNPRLPARFFRDPPQVVSTLHPARAEYRVFHLADWFGGDQIGLMFPSGDARYWIARNGLFPAFPAAYGIRTVLERDYDATALLPTIDFTDSMWEVLQSGKPDWLPPFLAMSNAWYRAAIVEQRDSLRTDAENVHPIRFVEGKHYPRYYFADQIVETSGKSDFVRKLSSSSFQERVAFIRQPAFSPVSGRVNGVRESSNSAIIDVETDGRAFLVMSVTPHKYWRITLDGARVEAMVTNVGYQGVVVPAGRHRIEMRYRNPLIERGAILSAAAVLLLCMAAIAGKRRDLDA